MLIRFDTQQAIWLNSIKGKNVIKRNHFLRSITRLQTKIFNSYYKKIILNMSKQFKVEYHGCGACYADRTLQLISRNGGCYKPTTYPFWKEPEDVINRVSTRQQLKQRSLITNYYIAQYYDLLEKRMAKYLNETVATDAEVNPDNSDSNNSSSD